MQTALNAFSVPLLKSWISAVSDLTRIRANLIRERLLKEGEQVGFSEVFDHCILQTLNRYNSHLSHVSVQQFIHPEDLYRLFVGYVSELNTYTQLISGEFSPNPYTHGDLFFSFAGLFNAILSQLNQIIVKNVMPFDLFDRGQGYNQSSVALLPDGFKLILIVSAAMPPEMLSKRFLAQVKVGAFESLSELIKAHLPGARLQTLQQISRQIPHVPNAVFFEILQQGAFWDQIKKTGSLGLHVAGDFPSLNIMVWGVQDR